jgi:hypothetical protein
MARRRYDEDIDPLSLINQETIGNAPIDPFLSEVAPGLVGPSDARFASKELNVGRGAVTGRAFRSPRVRSKSAEEEAAIRAGLYNNLANRNGYNFTLAEATTGQSDAIGAGRTDGIGGVIGEEFGLGLLSNIARGTTTTGAVGLNLGASGGDIVGAMPGAIAGAVKGAVTGPFGAGLGALGVSDAIASPIGAANTIGGLAATAVSAGAAENRARNVPAAISGFSDVGPYSGAPESRAAAERAAAPPRGTGLLGYLGEYTVSSLGDLTGLFGYEDPTTQAENALMQAEFERSQVERGRLPGDVFDQRSPGLASRALGYTGDAINRGLQAIGGYASRRAAEEAGFRYNIDDSGQISIEPPSMNMFGLDDRERRRREFGGGESEGDTGGSIGGVGAGRGRGVGTSSSAGVSGPF